MSQRVNKLVDQFQFPVVLWTRAKMGVLQDFRTSTDKRFDGWLNSARMFGDDHNFPFSPPVTRRFSSLYHMDFGEPLLRRSDKWHTIENVRSKVPSWSMNPPTFHHTDFGESLSRHPEIARPTDNVRSKGPSKSTSTSVFWLALPLLSFFICALILLLLRKIVQCLRNPKPGRISQRRLSEIERQMAMESDTNSQEQNEDNLSLTLSIESESSYRIVIDTDLPPSYSECKTDCDGINKNLGDISEEMPPPYSTILETLRGTEEVENVHKEHRITEAQANTNIRLDTEDIVRNNSGEQTDSEDHTSHIVETTRAINNDNSNDETIDTKNENLDT